MIDIELIRTSPEKVKESEINRFRDPSIVDKVSEIDNEWKTVRYSVDQINKKMNILQKEVKEIMKRGKKENNICNGIKEIKLEDQIDPVKKMVDERNALKKEKEILEQKMVDLECKIKTYLKQIGNIVDFSVIISKNEDDNPILQTFKSDKLPKLDSSFKILSYSELFSKINGVDQERGSRISGHRGYFMLDELAHLGNCLSRYAIDFMRKKGYCLIQPPLFMNKDIMSKTAQLSDFDDQLYCIDNEAYLIATSEQPLTAFHLNEILLEADLPKKYVGQSYCFRKEAGAHGKDNQGIFRVHQFEKIEQFVICKPEESNEKFGEMLEIACEFYKSLGISYNVVGIVSGELNDAASIKNDVECWFPCEKRFRELVSCSNCTDYQSRDLNVRLGYGKQNIKKSNNKMNETKDYGVKVYPHMLNCTIVAVQRTLCCLVENYQLEDCILIPDVLVKYYGKDRIFFK